MRYVIEFYVDNSTKPLATVHSDQPPPNFAVGDQVLVGKSWMIVHARRHALDFGPPGDVIASVITKLLMADPPAQSPGERATAADPGGSVEPPVWARPE